MDDDADDADDFRTPTSKGKMEMRTPLLFGGGGSGGGSGDGNYSFSSAHSGVASLVGTPSRNPFSSSEITAEEPEEWTSEGATTTRVTVDASSSDSGGGGVGGGGGGSRGRGHLTAADEASRPFYLKTFWKLTLFLVSIYVFLGGQLDYFVMASGTSSSTAGVIKCYYNYKCIKPLFIPGPAGTPGIQFRAFNNIVSNLGYISFGHGA